MVLFTIDSNVQSFYDKLNKVQVLAQSMKNTFGESSATEKTDEKVNELFPLITDWRKQVKGLKGEFEEFSYEIRKAGKLPKKLDLVEAELKSCKVALHTFKESNSRSIPIEERLKINKGIERLSKGIKELEEKIHGEKSVLSRTEEDSEVEVPKKAKGNLATRFLALRDAVLGAPMLAVKGVVTLALKFLLSLFAETIRSYRYGFVKGTSNMSVILLRLLGTWGGATIRTILWLPRDIFLATVGIFRPSAWVKVVEVDKGSSSAVKNVASGFYGVLSPKEGRVSGVQDNIRVKYTTRLEEEVDYRENLFAPSAINKK